MIASSSGAGGLAASGAASRQADHEFSSGCAVKGSGSEVKTTFRLPGYADSSASVAAPPLRSISAMAPEASATARTWLGENIGGSGIATNPCDWQARKNAHASMLL